MKIRIMSLLITFIICITSFTIYAQEEVTADKLEKDLNKNYHSEIKELAEYIEQEGEEILASLSIAGPDFKPTYFDLDGATKQHSGAVLNDKDYEELSTLVTKIKSGSDDWIVPVYDINNKLCTFVIFRRGITIEQAKAQNRWWPDKETKDKYLENIIRNEGKWKFESGAINPPKEELDKYRIIFDKELLSKKLLQNNISKIKSIDYIDFDRGGIKALLIDSGLEVNYYIIEAPYSEILEDSKVYSEKMVLDEIEKMINLRKEFAKSGDLRIGGISLGNKQIVAQYVLVGVLLIVGIIVFTIRHNKKTVNKKG
jgi:hypothetical protein